MATTYGSLQHMFENPLPENPTLLESLSSSFKQIKSMNPLEDSSFTEIFGELHFKEHHHSSSTSSPVSPFSALSSPLFSAEIDKEKNLNQNDSTRYYQQYKHGHDFSSKNSDSLSLCTEGLGFESSGDVEDLNDDWQVNKERPSVSRELKRSKLCKGSFPPPISSIGRSGKPWVWFKSFREDGRFILKEIRIPTQEFLRACREDGRLKLQFIQSDDDEIPEEDDDEDDEEEDDDQNGTVDTQAVKDDDFQAIGNDKEEENETDNIMN